MTKVPPPVLGFNNNVRHRGRIFHIQTEDSGVRIPRIVTHLFADGGRIIKTLRTDYTQELERPDLTNVVRQLMKAQHKAMFTSLRAGDLDQLLEAACGPLPLPPARDSGTLAMVPGPASVDPSSARLAAASARIEDADAATSSGAMPVSTPTLRSADVPSRVAAELGQLPASVAELDPGPLVAAATAVPATPAVSSVPAESSRVRKSSPSASRKQRTPTAPPTARVERTTLSRPTSRYGSVPNKTAQSIFGDGVISEKSLDEVILSYLADDLDGSSE